MKMSDFASHLEKRIEAVKYATTRLPKPLHNVVFSIEEAELLIKNYKMMYDFALRMSNETSEDYDYVREADELLTIINNVTLKTQ